MTAHSLPQRKSLFWDTDPALLDIQKNSTYIVERILDFGNDTEVKWLFQQYPSSFIKAVVYAPRSQLHNKSQVLWKLVLSSVK